MLVRASGNFILIRFVHPYRVTWSQLYVVVSCFVSFFWVENVCFLSNTRLSILALSAWGVPFQYSTSKIRKRNVIFYIKCSSLQGSERETLKWEFLCGILSHFHLNQLNLTLFIHLLKKSLLAMFGYKCKYWTECISKHLECSYEYFFKWYLSCPASKCPNTRALNLEHLCLLNL